MSESVREKQPWLDTIDVSDRVVLLNELLAKEKRTQEENIRLFALYAALVRVEGFVKHNRERIWYVHDSVMDRDFGPKVDETFMVAKRSHDDELEIRGMTYRDLDLFHKDKLIIGGLDFCYANYEMQSIFGPDSFDFLQSAFQVI